LFVCLSAWLGTVHDIVNRGGRCLIPVFALGRAQELLLILGRYLLECCMFLTTDMSLHSN